MPLPSISAHGAKQCSAKSKRSQQRCKNPAKGQSNVCRLHGWRDPNNIKLGKAHHSYTHGNRSLDAQIETSSKLCELRHLEDLGYKLKIMVGHKTPGRKPRGY